MPITSITATPNNEQGWKGEQKLLGFGHYTLVLLWEVDVLRISGQLVLRTAALGEDLEPPKPPVGGTAMIKLSGYWTKIGTADVSVTFTSATRTLVIEGNISYEQAGGPAVTVNVKETIQL